MGNNFTKPTVDKRENAVEQQMATEQENTQAQAERVVTTAVDVHKNGVDQFVKFLKGEFGGGSVKDRQKYQKDFIQTIWTALEMDYHNTKQVLDYLLITINEEKDAFEWSAVIKPLTTLEGVLGDTELTRYKRFMTFITLLAQHARNRPQFIRMFDMTKFESMFPPTSRQNLHTYVYR
jgi:hypothetical protein